MGEHNTSESCEERLSRLEAELDLCRQENIRLKNENRLLHDTAWELIRKIKEIEDRNRFH